MSFYRLFIIDIVIDSLVCRAACVDIVCNNSSIKTLALNFCRQLRSLQLSCTNLETLSFCHSTVTASNLICTIQELCSLKSFTLQSTTIIAEPSSELTFAQLDAATAQGAVVKFEEIIGLNDDVFHALIQVLQPHIITLKHCHELHHVKMHYPEHVHISHTSAETLVCEYNTNWVIFLTVENKLAYILRLR